MTKRVLFTAGVTLGFCVGVYVGGLIGEHTAELRFFDRLKEWRHAQHDPYTGEIKLRCPYETYLEGE